MRRTVATVGALMLGLVALAPGAAVAAPGTADPGPAAAERAALSAGVPLADKAPPGSRPRGPNPFLAFLPDPSTADYSGWAAWLDKTAPAEAQARQQLKKSARAAAASPVVADEDEPAGTRGANDTPAAGQLVKGFGTAAGQNPKLRVLGALSPESVSYSTLTANPEDDGSIPLARDTGIGVARDAAETTGVIGDGPHGKTGTGTGDFDFYKVTATAGEIITVQTATPTGPLDTVLVLFDASGTAVATNDDGSGIGFDSKIAYPVATTGAYYAMVTGYGVVPADPNDPASGDGFGSEGPYTLTLAAASDDRDFFAVKLRKGDVLGASVKGSSAYLTVYDTVPSEVHGSQFDYTSVYPMASPLPGGGNAVTDYVAERAGWHYVGVAVGKGSYDITVEAYRPALEDAKPTQTVFLDFDGARVNTAVFDGPGVVQLSPLAAFLAKWGIARVDEDAVIDRIVERVTENIKQDMVATGLNARFKLKVTNSRDHADTFGKANVSRIIVGGTVAESGVDTIGIAQSIDPGNFDTEETALVLLDYLSDPAGDDASLNTYLSADSDRIAFVGDAVGNVVAHEAGHFFGNWHTDQFNANPDLQDQGGNFPPLYGVGPDGVGGTADDPDVDFGHDTFNPNEGFIGSENTQSRIVFGVTS
jgi:hypothetical protein